MTEDRWQHLREATCPHGIIRGIMVCPACDPEAQASAEAAARRATSLNRDAVVARVQGIAGKLADALDGDADRQYAAEQTLADLDALVLDLQQAAP